MSTLHHSVHWSNQRSDAEKHQFFTESGTDTYAFTTYKGKKLFVSTMHVIGSLMCDAIIEKVGLIAKENIRRPTQTSKMLGVFSVNPTKTADEVCGDFLKDFSSTSRKKSRQLTELHKLTGLDQKTMILCAKKMSDIVKAYMQECRGMGAVMIMGMAENSNKFLFQTSQKPRDVAAWEQKMILDCMNHLYEKLRFEVVGKATITDVQLGHFEVGANAVLPEPAKLSCLNYALLLAGDKSAKEQIFSKRGSDRRLMNPVVELSKQGWRVVENPDEGDLVLYYNPVKKMGMHAGIYGEDGKVISKLGINNPLVHKHGLFDVCALYGSEVMFMRKSNATI